MKAKKENYDKSNLDHCRFLGHDRFSEDFSDALQHCVRRLNPKPDEWVLDVATGTGGSARLAATKGCRVIGLDYSEVLIKAARTLALDRHLNIQFDVGDAQQLPYADQSFDAVMSTFGVMFAAKPELVASELARVCKPGGRLALAVWHSDCTLARLSREVVLPFSPKPC
ncbi:MAG: class I SAM-dependent methyltransferase [Gammaproteobacteria bacterium]|nr:class I SAM-dependent methyltransferase [Gammaproteobacteria bacterium]